MKSLLLLQSVAVASVLAFFPSHEQRFPHYRPLFGMTTAANDAIVGNPQTWAAYAASMEDVMNRDRVLRKDSVDDMRMVQNYLLSNERVTPARYIASTSSATSCRDEIKEQKAAFLEATGFTVPQYDYCTRCLGYFGDYCAKNQSPLPAIVGWYKLKESGCIPRENSISTYMYVLGLAEDVQDSLEAATFHDLLFEPNEKTVTIRIKSLISLGDAAAAEKVLASLPDNKGDSGEWKKLRTFQPILLHYCSVGDISSVLRLFRQLRQSDGAYLDTETYATILSAVARQGLFWPDADPLEAAIEFGLATHGPELFDGLASEMAEDLLELSEEAAQSISAALHEAFGDDNKQRLIAKRVSIDESTAVCTETGTKLRLFALTSEQRRHVHDTLLEMAAARIEEFKEKLKQQGKKRPPTYNSTYAYENLSAFSAWLQERDGEPFTAVVDGPNIAYYGHGSVHYSQVQQIVTELEAMGETPLVTMPQKYINQSFWLLSVRKMQELTPREIQIRDELLDSGKMYVVPDGCLDDYYWMLASVANQTESKMHVGPDNQNGRFPGLRPMLITNDQMRDHWLSLLEPREFRRWVSCHIVGYDIAPYENDEWAPRAITFCPADFFSREMQGNQHPSRSGSLVWHFPVTGWSEEDRLCIFIAR